MAEQQVTKLNKGGYDYEFVEVPSKSLECPICLLTLRDPHVISCCGNHFCRPCIERVQRDMKPCPLCNESNFTVFLHKGVVREVNALAIWCPQKALGCQWKGELGSVQRHKTVCGFVEVGCVYGCGKRFLCNLMGEHEAACLKRPIEQQLSSIMQKLDAVLADNRALTEVVKTLKEENHTLKEGLRAVSVQSEAMQADGDATRRQVAQLKSTVGKLHHVVTPVPPQSFLVDNVALSKKESIVWTSPPFYSHFGGYKMRLDVWPNGYGLSVGTSIACFVCLEDGEYDDELQWPFQGSVTIQLLNRMSHEWDEERTFDFLHGENSTTRKPNPKHPNDGCGFHSYVTHTKLKPYTGEVDAFRVRVACIKVNM